MTSTWSYGVTHFDTDTSTTTIITDDVISIPLFTDIGSGEVNSARIVLSADRGKFLTSAPLIKQFDRIRLTVLDGFVGGSYDRVFDVIKIIPSEDSDGGTRVTLILLGIENHLMKMNYSKTHFFEGASEVIEDIGDFYNVQALTKQPTLLGHNKADSTNEAPTAEFQTNIYDYGINEDFNYNRINETTDKLGSSVDDGGALDFFDVRIDTSPSNFTDMTISIFPSGKDGTEIIEDTETVNMGETEGGIDVLKATLINAWGAVDQGSLPIDHSRFKSGEQRFPFHPQWNSGETYQLNSRVQDNGIHYKSLINNNIGNTPASNPSLWQVITTGDEYGNVIEYSPWTNNKAGAWINAGCDLGLTTPHFGDGCWDSNLVIWDDDAGAFQTWADVKATNPANISVFFKYNNQSSGNYRGLRCLVNGTGAGDFSGNDINGRAFTNSVAEYDGTQWKVKYPQQTDLVCAVINEGVKYRFSGSWIDDSGAAGQNDCWHPYVSLTNQPGIITNFGLNANSAIRVRYEWNIVEAGASGLGSTNANAYKVGAWLNFRFPYPHNDLNGLGEDVGDLYGGGTNPTNPKEPATLDQQNMHLTHDGLRGFGHGLSSEDYGQISSLDFWTKLHFQDSATGIGAYNTVLEANFNMRCLIYDTSDNVIFQDFVIRFNNHWEPVSLPLSGFSVYRGRKPLENVIATIIPPKAIEAQNIFEMRNIKQIVIQTQDSYDSQGRYNQIQSRYNQAFIGSGSSNPFRRIDLYLDAFRFTKPLLVNTGIPIDRHIETDFIQRPDIGNYDQLKSDAFAELQKAQFQHVQYDMTTTGRFLTRFGNSFWFRNPRLVPTRFNSTDSPDGNNNNTIKVVAKRMEYSITDAKDGKGGFLRKMVGVRRFT